MTLNKYDVHANVSARNLGPHQAVVIWLPLESSTEVFVIGPNATAWHELPEGRRVLQRRVAAIREAIKEAASSISGASQPHLATFPTDEARALYKGLFAPLEADLHNVTHIFCAQLGVTGGLPLHLLRTDAAGGDATPAWLGDRFAITRMPGLLNPVLLYGAAQGRARSRRLLAVGAPTNPGAAAILNLAALPNAPDEMCQCRE
ncbi:MAG: CHAT domain-containing protein [Candidatus Binataceae bacterium]